MNKQEEQKIQLKRTQQSDIKEFNTSDKLVAVRKLYKDHFDRIALYIKNTNPRTAIEDIANINPSLNDIIYENDNFFLLQQINTAIKNGVLSKDDIK